MKPFLKACGNKCFGYLMCIPLSFAYSGLFILTFQHHSIEHRGLYIGGAIVLGILWGIAGVDRFKIFK